MSDHPVNGGVCVCVGGNNVLIRHYVTGPPSQASESGSVRSLPGGGGGGGGKDNIKLSDTNIGS